MARFSLADFGLGYTGMNEVLEQRAARDRAEQDRAYELERRKRQEEIEKAKMEELRRAQAYEQELRSTLPQFLAGGERAIPAQPAVAGQVLDPRQMEGGDVPIAGQAAKPAQDNTEGLYQALQGVAAKHGRLDHYEAMKKRLKEATDEGVLEFIKKAYQGAPDAELVDTFNRQGKVKLGGIRRVNEDEFAAVTQDGQPVRLSLSSLTESLLAPKDLIAHRDRSAKTAAQLEARRLGLEQQDRANAARAGEREARIMLATSQAALADARANAAGGTKPRGAGNWNAFDNQVKALAREQLTSIDPDTGKKVVDHKNVAALTSMASALARRDPDAYQSPGAAIAAAAETLEELRGAQESAREQAESEAKGLTFEDPKKRDRWINNRAERLTKTRTAAPQQGKTPTAPAKATPVAGPKPGDIVDGYRFKGGNPNDAKSWEKV